MKEVLKKLKTKLQCFNIWFSSFADRPMFVAYLILIAFLVHLNAIFYTHVYWFILLVVLYIDLRSRKLALQSQKEIQMVQVK